MLYLLCFMAGGTLGILWMCLVQIERTPTLTDEEKP